MVHRPPAPQRPAAAAPSGRRVLFSLLAAALLFSCAAPVQPDPRAAEEHRLAAEALILRKDYSGAAAELAAAIPLAPDRAELWLRRGELLEALGRNRDALRLYQKALEVPDLGEDAVRFLQYRAGLIEVLDRGRLEEAGRRLPALASAPSQAADLEGVIALTEGDPTRALRNFNSALKATTTPGQAARILYHAALAYRRLEDDRNTYGSLYEAINRAEDLGLVHRIEILWQELNREDDR